MLQLVHTLVPRNCDLLQCGHFFSSSTAIAAKPNTPRRIEPTASSLLPNVQNIFFVINKSLQIKYSFKKFHLQ